MAKTRRSTAQQTLPTDSVPSIVPKSNGTKTKIKLEHLKTIFPKTDGQKFAMEEFFQGQHIFLHGSAGTGKTLISLYCALKEVLDKSSPYDRIVLLKSITPVKSIGFIKGSIADKTEPYESPFKELCKELLPSIHNPYEQLKEQGIIEFHCTSFLRGITFNNTIVIVDESQNLTFQPEADMILSRLGVDSRIMFAGDYYQSDMERGSKSGFDDLLKVVKYMDEFTDIEFGIDDIVRSKFCKNYIIARLKLGI